MADHADFARSIAEGRSDDPFAWLGPHDGEVRCILPGAEAVELVEPGGGDILAPMTPIGDGLFVGPLATGSPYRLRVRWPSGFVQIADDPYRFGVQLSDLDLYLFSEGRHWDLPRVFGAQLASCDGIDGVRFSVWAPNARRVSVVGAFSGWDGRRLPMRRREGAGVWELFVPGISVGELYKFEVLGADGSIVQKADPLARATELPPGTASIVAAPAVYDWSDADWMTGRAQHQAPDAPIAIYEVHAGSWMRDEAGDTLDWAGLAKRLIPYVAQMGFTHVELLPVMEHPFGGSWGYQPLSQFAPSARFGAPEAFARFVDECHRHGIGVILDWVPAHFPTDAHGLAHFDGTHLYEHADPREGFHQDWNTLIYNLGRREVAGTLLASALWWLEAFHIDGLRVDAVASMLYRDYSRNAGEWVPNVHGGRENLESVAFLQRLNELVGERCPSAITIAEESTAWPGVSAPVAEGGLGFSYKWNMGWMHDTLHYAERDPLYRSWHHNEMTFGLVYAFSERFVLPISHDEVVHGKGSLIGKMPGDNWQKRATLRAYLSFMWTHPGKKLLFMGCEIGQPAEWNHDDQIDWGLLDDPDHGGIQRLVRALNRVYTAEPALYRSDCDPAGFEWIVGDDSANMVFGYERRERSGAPDLVVLLNMGTQPRVDYRVMMPRPGRWTEILNSDASIFGGSNVGNAGFIQAEPSTGSNRRGSACVTLPPLGALILRYG